MNWFSLCITLACIAFMAAFVLAVKWLCRREAQEPPITQFDGLDWNER